MAAFRDQGAAALDAPDAVDRRVRAAVRLLAGQAEDLGFRLFYDLALFLDGGGVDEILRVAQRYFGFVDGVAEGLGFFDHSVQHLAFGELSRTAEEAGEWLFH